LSHSSEKTIGEESHRDIVIGITFMEPTLVEAREDLKMRRKKKQKACKQKKREGVCAEPSEASERP
jgi:hypothetical protein